MAWDQLSPASLGELQRRTEHMARERVAACWICDQLRHWLGLLPSIQITTTGGLLTGALPDVVDGHRRYDTATWHNPGPVRLDTFVTAVLTGNLINIVVQHGRGLYFPGSLRPEPAARHPGMDHPHLRRPVHRLAPGPADLATVSRCD
ncbi:hypothetical protein [Nonomuraea basaltis]|uniref:hypothetical protein n=1 Tax=Nonomuraea basaltis TaxID=2495887 RepID=UPI00110C4C5D|nr:hypothetical protein [Nonomuraea basaltis]TMR93058.1 hypothetical protein EJK15_41195 [Nonomuraea basaltis]